MVRARRQTVPAVALISVTVTLMLMPMTGAAKPPKNEYLSRLATLEGTPYFTLDCATFICVARQHLCKGARAMFNGCNGALRLLAEVSAVHNIDTTKLQPGDVADFHGVHVAVFMGYDNWMDSDPIHDGVAFSHLDPSPFDPWFKGPIRILRWN